LSDRSSSGRSDGSDGLIRALVHRLYVAQRQATSTSGATAPRKAVAIGMPAP
jgi:hypothetical protein